MATKAEQQRYLDLGIRVQQIVLVEGTAPATEPLHEALALRYLPFAITLMLNAKKGLSAMQAARDLEMRRPTVWSMMHRVRAAWWAAIRRE